ncbi:isoprenyl transferase [Futiania mangrovi]|uniref:Isoprenyl transferase n=1 Tax=Futiania mangrovi TaxID=2959716 RepID=A0A9J6PC53_9PROT|nr:isoprenyl transferase [Futiania mangrovii]MCP1335822.1 isoprenyl transferase [Futiania mangrovii]
MLTAEALKTDTPRPRHVAIIMDGNGRWAQARHMPRTYGHQKGVDAVRRTVETAGDLGVEYLTLYAFSSENWKRPAEEVQLLMDLLRRYIRQELAELHRKNVRVRFIGDRSGLASDIVSLMENAEAQTAANTGLTLVLALNYGSKAELTRAIARAAKDIASGTLTPCAMTPERIDAYLETAGIPDPDLVIRTSGEKRLSNFLLWQAAYAELVFIDTLWPDFGRAEFEAAIFEFQRRERRFGAAS